MVAHARYMLASYNLNRDSDSESTHAIVQAW